MPPTPPKSDSGVAELQRVLKAYVQITGYTPADPGTVDGLVGVKTAMAVIAMLPRAPGLPDEVRALAPVMALMLATADGQEQVYGIIRRNAGTISKAIIALEAYRIGTGGSPGTTPVSTSVKNGTLLHPGAAMPGTTLAPIVYTGGGTIPGDPKMSIWFHDIFRSSWRVAVPKSTLAGFADYVEVAPAASRPNFGVEVSRSAFMSSTGRWWGTYAGMAAIAGGVLGGGYAAFRGARSILS